MTDDTILKFPVNEAVDVRLKSTTPFWSGIDKYKNERFGYELHGDISGKEKIYISKTCHELIQISGVKSMDLFKLMLKNENNKSIWLLSRDGKEWKNKFQYHDDKNNTRSNDNEISNLHKSLSNNDGVDGSNINDEIQGLQVKVKETMISFAKRLDILEQIVLKTNQESIPETTEESDIPF